MKTLLVNGYHFFASYQIYTCTDQKKEHMIFYLVCSKKNYS